MPASPSRFTTRYVAAASLLFFTAGTPAQTWFPGHFLSAVSLAYATTGNPLFKIKADTMVASFAKVQQKRGTGDMSLNGVNVPWYVYHKAFAGLVDADLWTGNPKGLEVAKHLADWVGVKSGAMGKADFQRMRQAEFGGMEEVLETSICGPAT